MMSSAICGNGLRSFPEFNPEAMTSDPKSTLKSTKQDSTVIGRVLKFTFDTCKENYFLFRGKHILWSTFQS